jgi:hypothetical protein
MHASSRTVYPALTRRSRQSTKKLGSREVQQPCTLKELFEEHKLVVLEVEKVEEPKWIWKILCE